MEEIPKVAAKARLVESATTNTSRIAANQQLESGVHCVTWPQAYYLFDNLIVAASALAQSQIIAIYFELFCLLHESKHLPQLRQPF